MDFFEVIPFLSTHFITFRTVAIPQLICADGQVAVVTTNTVIGFGEQHQIRMGAGHGNISIWLR
jgi:hypothetical protein